MTRAVLDTNVLASGLISSGGTPARVVQCWSAGLFEMIISEHILTELERTLTKPYFRRITSPDWAAQQVAHLRTRAFVIPITAVVDGIASHPEDDLVLATAISGGADYLVTGDRALLRVGDFRGIAILEPISFLAALISSESGESATK